jgi:hypothetical protein
MCKQEGGCSGKLRYINGDVENGPAVCACEEQRRNRAYVAAANIADELDDKGIVLDEEQYQAVINAVMKQFDVGVV